MASRAQALFYFGILMCLAPVHGQTLTFLRQLTAPEFIEGSTAIAADGNEVYVAGVMRPSNGPDTYGFNTDAFLRKYDSTGAQVWARRFGGPLTATGIATVNGAVFVAGYTGWNISAQVYFTLPGQTGSGFPDAFVRRYDSQGNEVWTHQFGGEGPDSATGIAADATGVYVAGQFGSFTGPGQAFLRKYDLNGNELWTKKLDIAAAVAIDSTGVYVAGAIPPAPGGNQFKGIVSKFDAAGTLIWTQSLDTGAIPTTLVAGAAGVYVYGRSQLLPGKSFLRSYDPDGNVQWTREFPIDAANRLAVDATGVYLAGITSNTLEGQCSAGANDVFVRSYSLSGDELWTHQFGSFENDSASQIAVNASGIYVSGTRADLLYYSLASGVFLAKLVREPSAASPGPRIRQECVLNFANYLGGGVAPGEIVTILGSAMGPAEPASYSVSKDGRMPTALAETRVLFNGVAAPLLSVSEGQITAIVPSAVADGTSVDVQAEYKGVRSQVVNVPVLASRPGVFSLNRTGAGQAAALNEDGTVNSPSNPATRGSVVTFYVTGAGQNATPSPDDQIQSDPPPGLKGPVSVVMTYPPDFDLYDGAFVEVLYAGGVPGSVEGLVQINVRLPGVGQYAPPPGPWSPQVFINNSWFAAGGIPSQNLVTISVR